MRCVVTGKKKDYTYMIDGFQTIVEERIRKAIRKGEFEGLPGSGRPLPPDDDRNVPEDLRLAYKILKNAGCIPPEIELRKQIVKTEELLAGMEDTAEKYRVMKKLNLLVLKLNSMRRGSIRFETPQQYREKLVERFGKADREK